jgi:hypothetical protein
MSKQAEDACGNEKTLGVQVMKALLYCIVAAVILVAGFMAVAHNASEQTAVQQTASNQAITTTACGGVGRGGGACTAQ